MQSFLRRTLSLVMIAALGVFLAGCDDSPSSVQDFDIQPDVEFSTSAVTLIVAGDVEGSNRTEVTVTYQGLDEHPSAQASGEVAVEKVTETGSPQQGEQTWEIAYDQSVDGVIQENVQFTAPSATGEVSGNVTVTVSAITISSNFTPGYAVAADYEDAQRDSVANGGTSISLDTDNVSPNSNGVQALQVDGTPGGSVTFNRRASLPGLDRFSFLVKQNPTSNFTLTLTFTEETDSGQAARQVEIPVPSGTNWLQYVVEFDQISEDFNPVATRAGGNGPLVSIEFSADANVTYYLDELLFGDAEGAKVEIMDFERTTNAYGPPFNGAATFGTTDDVATDSDGFTARTIEGTGFFGYNYGGDGNPRLRIDADPSDELVFRVNSQVEGTELTAFVETSNGTGGYTTANSVTTTLSSTGWQTVRIPLGDLGDDVSALFDPGIRNVGFNIDTGDADLAIDDIRIQQSDN